MCGGDPRLLFAALLGVTDAGVFKANPKHPIPTETELTEAVDLAFAPKGGAS